MEAIENTMSTIGSTFSTFAPGIPEDFRSTVLWILILGFIIAFILSFGVGANDVGNSFATSVGSGVLSLRNACIIATVFEVLGAITLGYKVSDTIRKGIIDPSLYKDNPKEYMLGNMAALAGSAIWHIIATFVKMPISGTHSIVGAVLGFSLVSHGTNGVNWLTFGQIVSSWFISPILSGIVSSGLYFLIRKYILRANNPSAVGLKLLPYFYGITLIVNLVSIFLDGPDYLKIKSGLPDWTEMLFSVAIPVVIGLVVAILVLLFLVPRIRGQINADDIASRIVPEVPSPIFVIQNDNGEKLSEPEKDKVSQRVRTMSEKEIAARIGELESPAGSTNQLLKDPENPVAPQDESYGIRKIFSSLQIMTAAFGSFAHGGNDVSNAIGPLIALWLVYDHSEIAEKAQTPMWLLVYGGLGISVGLWVWGRRVMKTMGEDLTKIVPSSGFTIELGAALTVLSASKLGLPVSTTHCKVGSVVFVGWLRTTREGVDWKIFRNIVLAWLVTVPVSGGLSAILMFIFRKTVL